VNRAKVRIADQCALVIIPKPTHQRVRICVLDDQLGARMTAVKLIKCVIDGYKPPSKLKALEAVWEDDDVKVAGSDAAHLSECVSWVNLDPKRTIVFLDRMLEYPGKCVDGLDLIPEFIAQGALVVMRSCNDSEEDMALYIERGAFGVVSKVLHGASDPDIVNRAKVRIADQCALVIIPIADQCGINSTIVVLASAPEYA